MGAGKGKTTRVETRLGGSDLTGTVKQLTYVPERMPVGPRCPLCEERVDPYVGVTCCGCENEFAVQNDDSRIFKYSAKLQMPERNSFNEFLSPSATLLRAPEKTVVVGDTHGNHDLLMLVLKAAGAVDEQGQRNSEVKRLVHIGDLIDGRNPEGDLQCLQTGEKLFDELLIGNHEAAYMGGTIFAGAEAIDPESQVLLNRLEREGKLVAATHLESWLLVHGGAPSEVLQHLDAKEARGIASALTEKWRFGDEITKAQLFNNVSASRQGIAPYSGILWCDFRELIREEEQLEIPQVVGHTPWNSSVFSPRGKVLNLDSGGIALRVATAAVIDEKGVTIHVAYREGWNKV